MFSITKRAGRFLLRARRCLNAASSALDQDQPKPSEDSTQSFVKQQILRAGLHYLKGDTEALKENVRRRRGSVDVDELVRCCCMSTWLLQGGTYLRIVYIASMVRCCSESRSFATKGTCRARSF